MPFHQACIHSFIHSPTHSSIHSWDNEWTLRHSATLRGHRHELDNHCLSWGLGNIPAPVSYKSAHLSHEASYKFRLHYSSGNDFFKLTRLFIFLGSTQQTFQILT